MSESLSFGSSSRPARKRRARLLLLAGLAVFAALAIAGLFAFSQCCADRPGRPALAAEEPNEVTLQKPEGIIYNTHVMPLSPVEAEELNALRPVDAANVLAADSFVILADGRSGPHLGAALHCLQQAIYYEAANESVAGQRAVAQIVLNRVRHPAFPNSVCGVVYQGAHLWTGCQFSFTCDGSLARRPSTAGFARARRIAEEALSGEVAPGVGNATHYHANYVVPYWSDSLDKVVTIGAHIFYAMRGPLGARRAFSAKYDLSAEFIHLQEPAEIMTYDDIDEIVSFAPDGEQVTVGIPALLEDAKRRRVSPVDPPGELRKAPRPALRADETKSELAIPEGRSELIVD